MLAPSSVLFIQPVTKERNNSESKSLQLLLFYQLARCLCCDTGTWIEPQQNSLDLHQFKCTLLYVHIDIRINISHVNYASLISNDYFFIIFYYYLYDRRRYQELK